MLRTTAVRSFQSDVAAHCMHLYGEKQILSHTVLHHDYEQWQTKRHVHVLMLLYAAMLQLLALDDHPHASNT